MIHRESPRQAPGPNLPVVFPACIAWAYPRRPRIVLDLALIVLDLADAGETKGGAL